jgi:hypothetical protein
MTQALWTQKGESLSHNNACKEFGLEMEEIIEGMKSGKLQYKVNYVHGNPYYKLLRQEVSALAIELRGERHFRRQEIEFKIKTINKEINGHKRKIIENEREKQSLIEQLSELEKE